MNALFATARARLRKRLSRFRLLVELRRRLHALRRRLRTDGSSDTARWEQRAKKYGARAVFNLRHSEDELARVTELQKTTLYPLLQAQLRESDHLVLDLGCGPGRFTADLARLTKGRAIGVDPIQSLLDLAPLSGNVEFRRMHEGRLPLEDGQADVIWICLVLGGLNDQILELTIAEIHRVLRPGGLLFLVENTSTSPGKAFWRFRSVAEYQRLLQPLRLEHLDDYDDLGERISILAGRSD